MIFVQGTLIKVAIIYFHDLLIRSIRHKKGGYVNK
jgi:hypothetical protein